MGNLDSLNRELADIQDRLLALAPDDFEERYRLQSRQDELRNEAAGFEQDWLKERSTEDLEAELAQLRRHAEELVASKSGMVSGKGGGSHSAVSGAFAKLALDVKQTVADEVGRILVRIDHIEAVLASRRAG